MCIWVYVCRSSTGHCFMQTAPCNVVGPVAALCNVGAPVAGPVLRYTYAHYKPLQTIYASKITLQIASCMHCATWVLQLHVMPCTNNTTLNKIMKITQKHETTICCNKMTKKNQQMQENTVSCMHCATWVLQLQVSRRQHWCSRSWA